MPARTSATRRITCRLKSGLTAVVVVAVIAAPHAVAGPPAGHDAGWFSAAANAITASEYHFTLRAGTWGAPNRALGLRSAVDELGFRITPRDESADRFELRMVLRAFGNDELHDVARGVVTAFGQRITIDRGALEEWLVNAPEGIEHGFTVRARPPGAGPLRLVVGLDGSLQAQVLGGAALVLRDGAGRDRMGYSALHAHDARGVELPAHMNAADDAVELVIEDGDAVYPVAIDPVLTPAAWERLGGQFQAHLGTVLTAAGDVNGDGYSDFAIAAPDFDDARSDAGRVLVYLGSAAGPGSTADWTVEGTQSSEHRGAIVAAAGDVNGDGFGDLLVGNDISNSTTAPTNLFLYYGSSTGLQANPAWNLNDVRGCGFLGTSCLPRGAAGGGDMNNDGYDDIVVVPGTVGSISLFVYFGGSAGLVEGPNVQPPTDEWFGPAVAMLGDVDGDGYDDVADGSPGCCGLFGGVGRAYVIYGAATGIGSRVKGFTSSEATPESYGGTVAGIGDWNGDGYADLAIGDPDADQNGVDSGYVEVHLGRSTGFTGTPFRTITASSGSRCGAGLGPAGDVNGDGLADFVVGEPGFNVSGVGRAGRVSVYQGDPRTTPPDPLEAAVRIEGAVVGDQFGASSMTAGDVDRDGFSDLLVGAPYWDGSVTDQGHVYYYRGSSDTLASSANWLYIPTQAGASLGFVLAPAGDVNSDGFSDLVVGAPFYDTGVADAGCAFVFYGGAAGLPASPSWQACADQASSGFGRSVAGVGDVDDDGYDDVAVGAPDYDTQSLTSNGAAFVWKGSGSGLGVSGTPANASFTFRGASTNQRLGQAVGSTDGNGDGYSDLAIGSDGQAELHYGGSTGPDAASGWSRSAGSTFGRSLAGAGDVNGDGYGDLVVGERSYAHGETGEGAAYLYVGSAAGLGTTPYRLWESNQASANFGSAVGSAGDVNGDGYADVFVAADLWDDTLGADQGRVSVYYGSASGPASTPNRVYLGNPGDRWGYTVATAGDVNADGYSDLAIGSPYYSLFGSERGTVFLYLGSSTGLGTSLAWSSNGPGAGSHYGFRVTGGMDVNGDGFGDLVYSRNIDPGLRSDDGGLSTFYGGVWARGELKPRQQTTALIGFPVAIGGMTLSSTSEFQVLVRARSAAGKARIRLEAEARKRNGPLGAVPVATATGAWFKTLSFGSKGWYTDRAVTLSGLPRDSYRWRVRVRAHSPFFPNTVWLTGAGHPMTALDIRMRDAVQPGKVQGLEVTKQSSSTKVSWSVLPAADDYDVVRGVLSLLRNSGGDFTAATTGCAANDVTATSIVDPAAAAPADGLWWLVRALNPLGRGSYDDLDATAARDVEIQGSGVSCP